MDIFESSQDEQGWDNLTDHNKIYQKDFDESEGDLSEEAKNSIAEGIEEASYEMTNRQESSQPDSPQQRNSQENLENDIQFLVQPESFYEEDIESYIDEITGENSEDSRFDIRTHQTTEGAIIIFSHYSFNHNFGQGETRTLLDGALSKIIKISNSEGFYSKPKLDITPSKNSLKIIIKFTQHAQMPLQGSLPIKTRKNLSTLLKTSISTLTKTIRSSSLSEEPSSESNDFFTASTMAHLTN
ncbi:unnamed protein product [Moneuplotes crassus]|uniref:Uncharacterized protein n=1 Tax=Euplotes crassus TaxID=5936 RepID=A0AAD1UCI2_EUPCR|nr:unnamed protein product [Moneuplotes crassus]